MSKKSTASPVKTPRPGEKKQSKPDSKKGKVDDVTDEKSAKQLKKPKRISKSSADPDTKTTNGESKKSTKRKSDDAEPLMSGALPPKRQKSSSAAAEDNDRIDSSSELVGSGREDSSSPGKKDADRKVPEKETQPAKDTQKTSEYVQTQDDSDSLSSVRDVTPPPKQKRKRKSSPKDDEDEKKASDKPSKVKKDKPVSKPKPPAESSLTPQEEEIKRLQSQLLKCGIRKIWSRELAHCDSAKEKIAHLKKMLRDAGIDGRFSEEKARQIKEERELRAELDAIQEGEKFWGQKGDKETEDAPASPSGRPQRKKIARGLQQLTVFDDDESE